MIITYYWPPSGGGGVQRWLKFVKYLRDFGWEPVIYTPENPSFDMKDPSLMKDIPEGIFVMKRKIWEPFEIYKKLLGSGKKKKLKQGVVNDQNSQSFLTKLSIWVRGNLFIPDARKYWVNPSIRFLKNYLNREPVDVVISTGPPHSMHLIALGLKKWKGNLKWVADFRDPWSEWDILPELRTTASSMRKHKNLEHQVLTNADLVLTVSRSLAESLSKIGNRDIKVITNGFDQEDVPDISSAESIDKFRISHVGLLNELRDPELLWQALEELCEEVPDFASHLEICLAGAVSEFVIEKLSENESLSSCLNYKEYIPHSEVFDTYARSSVLLLLVNETPNAQWILPGKVFEYITVGRPILSLGRKGIDVEEVLMNCGHTSFFEYSDKEGIKNFIHKTFEQYRSGNSPNMRLQGVDQYSRKILTKVLAEQLDLLHNSNNDVEN